ncbi:50S ribosomal protein L17 [Candidatus Saccharibacteria bacterium]|nr:50S ribosomal protein L17 [Candidatus Saccharibacteria bacterium]
MHRHGYKGRKFGRETDQRKALLRGLICALILNHSINTTLTKAKEMRRYTEKLVTLAKKGGLANRRLIVARLDSMQAAAHLIDIVVPAIKRDSGYLRIKSIGYRKGDNAEMATIAFVDEITVAKPEVKKPAAKPVVKKEKK